MNVTKSTITNHNDLYAYFSSELVFKLIIISQVADFIWDTILSYRQHRVYKTVKERPFELIGICDEKTFEKARLYALDKSSYGLVNSLFGFAVSMTILMTDGFHFMWNEGEKLIHAVGYGNYDEKWNEIMYTAAFSLIINAMNVVIKLPFSVYYTFVLEEKHGFNKQTPLFFVKDQIKAFIIGQLIMIPICCSLVYIVQIGGEYFFIYLWLFVMVVTVFLMTIYPEVIAPLFDKYSPLEDGELRTEIEKLAASINFPLTKLYVVEGSKRSAHSNAYFYGFFNNKRIVLFDTLLAKTDGENKGKGCNNGEILAVLGHELGHWKLNHVLKNIIISQVNTMLIFFVFNILFKHGPLYAAIGFVDSRPIFVGMLVIFQYVMTPYMTLLQLAMALLSRRFEFQADKFAQSLGRGYSLKSALIKLNVDNLGFPIYDSWYSTWHNSHPPLLERLQALEKDD